MISASRNDQTLHQSYLSSHSPGYSDSSPKYDNVHNLLSHVLFQRRITSCHQKSFQYPAEWIETMAVHYDSHLINHPTMSDRKYLRLTSQSVIGFSEKISRSPL